jgi:hypothetical protein
MLKPAVTLVACAAALCATPRVVMAQNAERSLAAVAAPGHDPLFVDTTSVQRKGNTVLFKYVLDVQVEQEGKPVWRSNEIDAVIDCARSTYAIRRLVAYPGPRATGVATRAYSFMAPPPKPEAIGARSTFAHLQAHLCGAPGTKG